MKPLLHDDSLTDDERALLRSAQGDMPSPALRAQTLAALGLGVAGVGSTVTAHAVGKAAATAGIGGGTAATASAGSTLTAMVVTKWLGAGALVGALASSGVVIVVEATRFSSDTHATRSAPSPADAPTPHATGTFPRAGRAPDGTEAPLRPIDDLPSVASQASDTERGAERPGATRPPAGEGAAADVRAGAGNVLPSEAAMPATRESRIAAEVASLDDARRALGSSDPGGALTRLDAHARRFPGGTLEPEAVLLRVRALVALGRREEARATAARFLAANPGSPQAARLQALVGG